MSSGLIDFQNDRDGGAGAEAREGGDGAGGLVGSRRVAVGRTPTAWIGAAAGGGVRGVEAGLAVAWALHCWVVLVVLRVERGG
jgi:hypothetical protein